MVIRIRIDLMSPRVRIVEADFSSRGEYSNGHSGWSTRCGSLPSLACAPRFRNLEIFRTGAPSDFQQGEQFRINVLAVLQVVLPQVAFWHKPALLQHAH